MIFSIILSIVAGSFLIWYIYYESRDYLSGPEIQIIYPQDKTEIFGPQVEVRGKAFRVNSITLNDSPIFIDETGAFSEKLILQSGYNIIKFEAKDRFGKETEKLLEFMVMSTPKEM